MCVCVHASDTQLQTSAIAVFATFATATASHTHNDIPTINQIVPRTCKDIAGPSSPIAFADFWCKDFKIHLDSLDWCNSQIRVMNGMLMHMDTVESWIVQRTLTYNVSCMHNCIKSGTITLIWKDEKESSC